MQRKTVPTTREPSRPLLKVCAWCNRMMEHGEPDENGLVSHGICTACTVEQLADAMTGGGEA